MHLDRTATIARIVTEHAEAARVFQKHGIDYCCHGNVTVSVAAEGRGLDPEALFAELDAVLGNRGDADEDLRQLSTVSLIARIVDRHHTYLRRALPYIDPIAAKVASVHGGKDDRLREIHATFRELADALLPHLDDEESVLFPALMVPLPDASRIGPELERMLEEHLAVGDLLAKLRALSDDYTTPEWGCNTYRVLMAELEALEADTLRHVHAENHILAPRVTGAIKETAGAATA
ncbi:MAG TPA: iron-sulfur cluster repair di-iron protein [Anaeromyxobacteraceae bacterium]|nr:iron-sulfur cluster repair di-iron protein [Anaeromyxobacteraceae bacterium]